MASYHELTVDPSIVIDQMQVIMYLRQKCSNFPYVYGPIHGTNLLTMSLWSITLNLVDWYFLMLSFSSWLDAFVTCLICIIMCLLLFICSLILSVGYNRWCRTLTGKYSPFSRSVPTILKHSTRVVEILKSLSDTRVTGFVRPDNSELQMTVVSIPPWCSLKF